MTGIRFTGKLAAGLASVALVSITSVPADAKRKPAPAPTPTATAASAVPPGTVIPARPTPPLWAPEGVRIPAVSATGVRQTINAGNTPVQTTWNFRAAYNVAALNCRDPRYDPIVAGYKAFLKKHVVGLAAANRGVDAKFRGVRLREAYMTQVYNFYSFPPTLEKFCDAALAMSAESLSVSPSQLSSFAAVQLPRLDAVFENFYRAYEQYKIDAAAWDAKYAGMVPRK